MKKKALLAGLLALALLCSGCKSDPAAGEVTRPPEVEPTAVYDWMAGESPVPNQRVGRNNKPDRCAISPTGIYYLYTISYIYGQTPPSPMILYADHGSDTLIKLCGRPDCTHDTTDCNAYVENGKGLAWHDGYLYAVSEGNSTVDESECVLLRMDPDGSNRTEIFDMGAFAQEQGCAYAAVNQIIDGYCRFSTYNWKDNDSGGVSGDHQQTYLFKLDGSTEPKEVDSAGWILYNCGDVTLSYSPIAENGGQYGSYWDWDAETDTLTFLTDHPGEPGWFGQTQAYYFMDGAVRRLTYATGEDEVVIETGLEGDYYAYCFPDCIVVANNSINGITDKNLYFYNWAFELVDTVSIEYSGSFLFGDAIMAETADRIILCDTNRFSVPTHYINKSELGTGNVTVHEFDLTSIADMIAAMDELYGSLEQE